MTGHFPLPFAFSIKTIPISCELFTKLYEQIQLSCLLRKMQYVLPIKPQIAVVIPLLWTKDTN